MKLTVLGVGDAFSARFYSSSMLIETEASTILIDCPHPIRKMLREATHGRVDIPDIDAIVLTHLHADHCSGLEGFAYFTLFALKRKTKLLLHPSVNKRLWDGSLAAGMESLILDGQKRSMSFDDYFETESLKLDGGVRFGDIDIECRHTYHHIPTTALRLCGPQRSLGFSADTRYDSELVSWLSEADVVLHETNLGIHTDFKALEALPPVQKDKLWVYHYTDAFYEAEHGLKMLEQGQQYRVQAGALKSIGGA